MEENLWIFDIVVTDSGSTEPMIVPIDAVVISPSHIIMGNKLFALAGTERNKDNLFFILKSTRRTRADEDIFLDWHDFMETGIFIEKENEMDIRWKLDKLRENIRKETTAYNKNGNCLNAEVVRYHSIQWDTDQEIITEFEEMQKHNDSLYDENISLSIQVEVLREHIGECRMNQTDINLKGEF